MTAARRAALSFVFLWFFIGGSAHFLLPQFFLPIMPPWVPFPLAAIYLSGAAELAGAFALLSVRLRPAAGIGLCLLILGVTPVHIWMLQVPERFPQFPLFALWLRLPIQVALLACVGWSTRPAPALQGNSPSR
ncbi:MAG: DoxX family protein [Nevskia sp.]